MKYFVIQTKLGRFFSLPECISSISFPLSKNSTLQTCTHFPFKSVAQYAIKKYKLKNSEIIEIDTDKLDV
jgi:hypothetical protein